jgi:hypothetical protein
MAITNNDARWIPIEALPVDLQMACAGSSDNRDHRDARVYQLSRWTRYACIAALLTGAVLTLASTRTPGFRSLVRPGLLMGGLALAGLVLAIPRTRRFLGPTGQRLVIGPTCLVIVDAEAVFVLPGEHLTLTSSWVDLDGEPVHRIDTTGSQSAELRRVCKEAAKPSARKADRFRKAAERGEQWTWAHVRWRRRMPALMAASVGVLVALILEAGPLHARGNAREGVDAKANSFRLGVEKTSTERGAWVSAIERDVAATEKALKSDKLLAAATSGREEDVRAFLQDTDADDPARPKVTAQLAAICASKPSSKGSLATARVQQLVAQVVCRSVTGKTFSYIPDAGNYWPIVDDRLIVDLVARAQLPPDVKGWFVLVAPKNEPYIELSRTKVGASWGGKQAFKVSVVVRDAGGVVSEPYTYIATIPDPAYVPPSSTASGSAAERAQPASPTTAARGPAKEGATPEAAPTWKPRPWVFTP